MVPFPNISGISGHRKEPQQQHGPENNAVRLVRSVDPNALEGERDLSMLNKSDQLVVHDPLHVRVNTKGNEGVAVIPKDRILQSTVSKFMQPINLSC
jgi:hypothetical protein